MMDKLGEFSLNQKEYDKWMILKDFDKNPKSIDDNEGKYPTCLTCFVISLFEKREEVHRYYQSSFQSRE